MKVLIVNDDGINSIGLRTLVEKLIPYNYQLLIVAPSEEKSAASHSLTIRKGIKLSKHEDMFKGIPTYSIDGTPADCVKYAKASLKFPFDLVVSGINNGLNLGHDILYSGTVAGASEAGLLGSKGIALSCPVNDLMGFNQSFDEMWKQLLKSDIYQAGSVFNINIPSDPKGIRITRQGYNPFRTKFEKRDNDVFYSTGRPNHYLEINDESTDIGSFVQGFISITPITVDRTDLNIYNRFNKL